MSFWHCKPTLACLRGVACEAHPERAAKIRRYEGATIGVYPPAENEAPATEPDSLLNTVIETAVVVEVLSDLFGGSSDKNSSDTSSDAPPDDYSGNGGGFGGGGADGEW